MRFSSYNILTRRLREGSYVILNSMKGTIDLIDEEAYELISSHEGEEILSQEVLEQLAELKDHFIERGYLTPFGRKDELAKAKEFAQELMENELKNGNWGIWLAPNLGCNYRCTYCFEQAAGYPTAIMSREQVDAVFEIIKGHVAPEETISLYGGEPLAKANRKIVEYIVEKGSNIGIPFFAITNAHDLNHYMDLIGSNKISRLQITVDGPRKIHDRRRISLDRASSYERVLANIETALRNTDVSIMLRINLDKENAPYIMELLQELEQRGILDSPSLQVTASPVVGVGDLTIQYDELRELEMEVTGKYPRFKDSFTNREISVNKDILPALYFGEPVRRIVTACGASSTSKVFAPDGKIYSCLGCVGRSDQIIGTYNEEGHINWNEKLLDEWKRTMLAYNMECLNCKYSFLCGGGCRRPPLPKETAAYIYDCDFYLNMFDDHLARVTETYLETENI